MKVGLVFLKCLLVVLCHLYRQLLSWRGLIGVNAFLPFGPLCHHTSIVRGSFHCHACRRASHGQRETNVLNLIILYQLKKSGFTSALWQLSISQDVAFLTSHASFYTTFLDIMVDVRDSGPPRLKLGVGKGIVGGKKRHGWEVSKGVVGGKILSSNKSSLLCQLNFIEIIRLLQSRLLQSRWFPPFWGILPNLRHCCLCLWCNN